jgi:hypothetical protein
VAGEDVLTYHVSPTHHLPQSSHRGGNMALASQLFATVCKDHTWADDRLWALPPLAKTWAVRTSYSPCLSLVFGVVLTSLCCCCVVLGGGACAPSSPYQCYHRPHLDTTPTARHTGR